MLSEDRNEQFIIANCSFYLHRHLSKFPDLPKETISILIWILNDEIEVIKDHISSYLTNPKRRKLDKDFCECDRNPDDYAGIFFRYLYKLKPNTEKEVIRYFIDLLEKRIRDRDRYSNSVIEKNIIIIKNMFDFTNDESEFLKFLFVVTEFITAENYFVDFLGCSTMAGHKYLANILDIDSEKLYNILSGPLSRISVFEIDQYTLRLTDEFKSLVQNPLTEDFSKKYYRNISGPMIPIDSHFLEVRQSNYILKLLNKKPVTPSHILLYGPPGTGKTSFSHGLAKKLKIPVFEIVSDEDNTTRHKRVAILACLNMTNSSKGSVIIVDEADNLLNTEFSWLMRGETQDKGWLNVVMEKTGVRMIWITNRTGGIEESVLRRFSFSYYFKPFNAKQRLTLWNNILQQNKSKRFFSNKDIDSFAKKYQINAGSIDLAVKKAIEQCATSKCEFKQAVEMSLDSHLILKNSGKKISKENDIDQRYSLEGLNITPDAEYAVSHIEKFNELLKTSDYQNNLNLLFYGPPGAGKSEFSRYIANHIDCNIIVKKMSQLHSKWVGETEKNIAAAFEEAESEEAVLVVDEIDSLLFPRDLARHSWEISSTNEFLIAMERFRGILICTTNRLEGIDNAAIRRFSIKIKFDYLDPQGNLVFYEKMLRPLSTSKLSQRLRGKVKRIRQLAPGDFKTVKDQHFIYRPKDLSHEMLIDALEKESDIKRLHQSGNPIGF